MRRFLLVGAIALALPIWLGGPVAGDGDPIDLTGDWDAEVRGDYPLDCSAQFQQTGDDVTMALGCGEMDIAFSGTVDLATRAFDVSGSVLFVTVESSGTVSEDGEALSGTWSAPSIT